MGVIGKSSKLNENIIFKVAYSFSHKLSKHVHLAIPDIEKMLPRSFQNNDFQYVQTFYELSLNICQTNN